MLKTEWLYYFSEVAKHSSTNLVAEKLYISQPTISRGISQLEQALNVQLFNRNYDGMQLTSAGAKLLPLAEACLQAHDILLTEAAALAAPQSNPHFISEPISLYASPAVIDYFAPAILQTPQLDSSKIRFVSISQNEIDNFAEIITAPNSLVLILTSSASRKKIAQQYTCELLSAGKLCISCAKNSKLIDTSLKKVSVKHLHQLPFLNFSKGKWMERVADDLFDTHKPPMTSESNYSIFIQQILNDKYVSFSTDIFKNVRYNNYIPFSNFNGHTVLIPISTKLRAEIAAIYDGKAATDDLHFFLSALKNLWN